MTGEWDPSIRIEPPSTISNQQSRIQLEVTNFPQLISRNTEDSTTGLPCGIGEEDDGHGQDPGLRRTGKLFGGLMLDIRRKAPHYLSDFTDALNLQCIATTCFMYFALLAPIVTFGGLLEEATHQRMAVMQNLASGAICGIIYHLFSGQPLTIIGSTSPVLVFETTAFDICNTMSVKLPDMGHGKCECTPNMNGMNSDDCEDFHNDSPWRPGIEDQSNEFYNASGFSSGGVRDDCQHNTMENNCEQCNPNFYRDPQR
uniref:Bicarbonate transporter-like transmembrane domain-containing protein n=1 Tax=Meloidogyne floridensis TaxID=298350 RepID=A0A915P7E2_9BILA